MSEGGRMSGDRTFFRPRHLTRTLFLRVVAFSYACAFLSLYPQIAGLYGPNGVVPLHKSLQSPPKETDTSQLVWTFEGLVKYLASFRPNLLQTLPGQLGLSPELALDLVCLLAGGLAIALTLMPK